MIDGLDDVDAPVASALSSIDSAVAAAVSSARERWQLHRVLRETEHRHLAGTATDEDARRHRMARLAVCFHGSPGRVPHLPVAVDLILRAREALDVELLVGPEVTGPAVTQ